MNTKEIVKHTPGPWVFVNVPFAGYIRPQAPGDPIANFVTGWANRTDDEQIANVRLITAAPELLEAAKEALSELEPTVSDRPGYYANPEQVERLRTAIAKAEGR